MLHRNAPHLVHDLPFVVPRYEWWEGPFYGIGLKLYDALAGSPTLRAAPLLVTTRRSRSDPDVEAEGLRGGIVYHDGQFDDARMVDRPRADRRRARGGGREPRRGRGDSTKRDGQVGGVRVADRRRTGGEFSIRARVVVNATGLFSDAPATARRSRRAAA